VDWSIPRAGTFRFYRVDYTTRHELEELTTVLPGGNISRNLNAALKESGSLPVAGPLSLGDDLVRVYYVVEDDDGNEEKIALATMHAVAETVRYSSATATAALVLYSALLTLQDTSIDASLTIAAGAVAVSEAAKICTDLGLPVVASASSKQLGTDMSFDAGTPYLAVVNELLAYAGYWSASVDGWGRVLMEPYQDPSERAPVWDFIAGANCIFLPDVEVGSDAFSVPNKYVLTCSNPDGAPLIGSYTNTDPASPFSTVTRGRTITKSETVNDAVDVADLNARAKARLITETASTETVSLQHAYAPVRVADAVSLNWAAHGLSMRGAIQSQDIALVPSALTKTTLKRIWR